MQNKKLNHFPRMLNEMLRNETFVLKSTLIGMHASDLSPSLGSNALIKRDCAQPENARRPLSHSWTMCLKLATILLTYQRGSFNALLYLHIVVKQTRHNRSYDA